MDKDAMIAFLYMAYEFEGDSWCFIDFEDLSEDVVDAIVEIRNRYKNEGDSDWGIEARFPEGDVDDLTQWVRFLEPENFFTYTKRGRPVPHEPGASRKSQRVPGDPKHQNIEPTDAFDKIPLPLLEKFAVAFREYLEDDSYHFIDEDEIVVFTPLFEKEVERRR
jgi:hypothetical protein